MRKNKYFLGIISVLTLIISSLLLGSCSSKKEEPVQLKCTYDGEKFDWQDVDNAKTYNLAINSEDETNSSSATVKSSSYKYDATNPKTNIEIKAVDENNKEIVDNKFSFTETSVFDTPTYDHGVIKWNALDNAAGYLVKIDKDVFVTKESYYKLSSGINNNVCVKPILDVLKITDNKYYVYSVPQTYEIMATPSFSKFEKGNYTFTWSSVSNAGGYYISILFDDKVVAEQSGIGSSATYYSGYSFPQPGEYTVKFSATKNSNENSYDSLFFEQKIIRLAAPKNLRTEEMNGSVVLKWDAVDNASRYRVVLPNGNSVETDDLYYKYITESKNIESNYDFKVYAISNNQYALDSKDSANISVVKLGEVQNIKIQGQKLTWDIVDKAQGYVVSVDGKEVNIDKNEYSFTGYTGSHKVMVKAIGNESTIISSDYSSDYTIYKLSQPTNLLISSGVLTWDPVNNATSYRVVLSNGNDTSNGGSYNATSNSFQINVSDLKESKTIQIIALGDGLTIADSDASNEYAVNVLPAPVVSLTTEGLVWNKIENATSYTVMIGDYKKIVDGTSINVSENNIDAGKYAVYVIANGDSVHYFNSEQSQVISLKLLNSPVVSQNDTNNGIVWDTVISASDYEVRVDSGSITSLGSQTRNLSPKFSTSGIHTISIRAVGDGVETVTSAWNTIQVNVSQLGTPTGFETSKEGQILTITANEVENACGYKFRIGGTVYTSNTNEYKYTINNSGEYSISVSAIGDGYQYIDSSFSKETKITVLNTPEEAKFEKVDTSTYLLSWSPVNNAVSYSVTIVKKFKDGSTKEITISTSTTEVTIDTTDLLSVSATIVTNGNNKTVYSFLPLEVKEVAIK